MFDNNDFNEFLIIIIILIKQGYIKLIKSDKREKK